MNRIKMRKKSYRSRTNTFIKSNRGGFWENRTGGKMTGLTLKFGGLQAIEKITAK